jgi:hypothetical protein
MAAIVLLVVVGSTRPLFAAPFPDLVGHWSRRYAEVLWARGVIRGLPDGRFAPDRPVTRAEVARLLVMALGDAEETLMLAGLPSSFLDLGPTHWANGYVEAAFERGLVMGYPDGRFRPDQPMTRTELVMMLARAGGWEEATRVAGGGAAAALPFADRAAIPGWAVAHVLSVWGRGLVTGFPDGSFRPGELTSRGQAAATISRFLEFRGILYDHAGELAGVDPAGWLTLRQPGGGTRSFALSPATALYRQGAPATIADLAVLDEVRAVVSPEGELRYLEAFLADTSGRLASLDQAGGMLVFFAREGGERRSLPMAKDAVLIRNGSSARSQDFRPGDELYLMLRKFTGEVRVLWATRVDLTGRVLAVDLAARRLDVSLAGDRRRLFGLAPSPVTLIDGRPSRWETIQPGDSVALALGQDGMVTFLDVARSPVTGGQEQLP